MADVFENSPELALEWHRAGKGAVLATVVETWGSAPRGIGAQMVVSGAGEMEGSVSGGCVEGAVVVEAMEMVGSTTGKMLEFGVSDDEAFAVGLACGGRIRIWLEPVGPGLPEPMLAELVEARAKRRAVAYAVDTQTGARDLRAATAGAVTGVEGDTFTHVFAPPVRVLIVGAVHIAQALVPMARLAGLDPVLIDPRGAFGAEARFPGERIVEDWPDEALDDLGLDAKTAVVTLTHDPKLDDPAIMAALKSDVFYLGCLGSSRTHAKRVARLEEAGIPEAGIARIHAPVGLDIGAKGPGEIAVSILAQIVARLRQA